MIFHNIFLKIDCEGGEYDVLLHADQTDMDRINTIAIEIHADLHPLHKGIHLIRNKLTDFGYKPIEQKQIGAWDGYNPDGTYINYKYLPLTQEIWIR